MKNFRDHEKDDCRTHTHPANTPARFLTVNTASPEFLADHTSGSVLTWNWDHAAALPVPVDRNL